MLCTEENVGGKGSWVWVNKQLFSKRKLISTWYINRNAVYTTLERILPVCLALVSLTQSHVCDQKHHTWRGKQRDINKLEGSNKINFCSFGLGIEKTSRRPEALSNLTNRYFYAWSEKRTTTLLLLLLLTTLMMMMIIDWFSFFLTP